MKLGAWTPLPHTIRPEPLMEAAIAAASTRQGSAKPDPGYEIALDFARRAEGHGFDTTLIAERYIGPDLESWILGSALASQTKAIEIMVAVHPGIVSPAVAAKMGASLDRISGGRAAVNIVNGWWEKEFEVFGGGSWLPSSEERYARMSEFMQVMRGLWSHDQFDFAGAHYSARGASVPVRAYNQPSIPIYAASASPLGRDAIARYADTWFHQLSARFDDFDTALTQARAGVEEMTAMSARYGRRVNVAISAHVICTDTMAEAERLARELEDYGKTGTVTFVATSGLTAALVGTPEVVAERLTAYRAAGIDVAMLHFHPMVDGLEAFAAEVLPLLDWKAKPVRFATSA